MGEPQRTADSRSDVVDVCPMCGSVNTVVTIQSHGAVYSRCSDCAHVWHYLPITHSTIWKGPDLSAMAATEIDRVRGQGAQTDVVRPAFWALLTSTSA